MNKEPVMSREILDKVYQRLRSIEMMIPENQDAQITKLRRWIEQKWLEMDDCENDQTHYGDAVFNGVEE